VADGLFLLNLSAAHFRLQSIAADRIRLRSIMAGYGRHDKQQARMARRGYTIRLQQGAAL